MGISETYRAAKHVIARLLRVLSRPVRRDRGSGGALIQPYLGYGCSTELYLMGRVFRQPRIAYRQRATPSRRDLLDVVRRVFRRGVGGVTLTAQLRQPGADAAAPVRVQTDSDGYFRVRLRPKTRLLPDQRWHTIDLELVEPAELVGDEAAKVEGHVYVPPADAERVIISDIDDTVMYTGVVNKAMMMWRLFMQGPRNRVAFPGVGALYRALHQGPSGGQLNPMLYVSRAPWSIYEVLQEFFRMHQIPVGPVLFLREWGLTLQRPLPRRAEDHKLILIREMVELYRDFPFVLIGDSGQHDPEIYARVVHEHPGRVAAVYIRNVSRSAERVEAIEELAKQVVNSGSTLMLAADTFSMAKHAAEHGLISSQALQRILEEQHADQPASSPRPVHEIEGRTDEQTQRAVEQGILKDALAEDTGTAEPPNVSVESTAPKTSLTGKTPRD